ncbi:MAG: hypothetical protein GY719_00415 [bacterium]|nr:hypothetical protein [bacterium]
MPADTTNAVTEVATRLGTLIDAHARDAGRQLGECLRPWLREGETLPDFTLVLQLPARMLRQAGQRLRRHRDELDEARDREREARFRRDQTASALHRQLVAIRRILTSAFGSRRAATLLGIAGKTARDSQTVLLLSQADSALERLRDPRKLAIPHPGWNFDPVAAGGVLEPLVAALSEARDQLDEIRQTRATRLEARNRARSEIARAVHCLVSILGGWFQLIRRTDLAKKVRLIQSVSGRAGNTDNRPTRREEPM